ncbi:uncharacterized protein FTOL_10705 [Fusarium torulosum]|uniref:Uncharacterized protein n=1 Tax=Fusarium torulosum TaxID=33205 RepID=A0AAE8SMR5_9HYPO|nr:uncharacterized protein FTOL_10705 [Fusarium torulosum]
MDASPSQGFDSENSTQTRESLDNIELGNHELWNELDPSPWQQAEDERDQLRGNDVSVQYWLQNQGNSQPAQGTFINSQSLHQRKRETSSLLVHVENVLGTYSKPSSAQAARTCDPTALRPRNPTASNIITSIDERRSQKPRHTVQSIKSSTTTDRKTRYPDNGNHDEGRPPSNWITQDRSKISATPFGPESRGALKQSVDPSFQQTAWSVAGTNTSSSSKKPPKRQNSRSTGDDTSRKHAFSKRNRSAINDLSWRRTSPTSSGSVQTDLAIPPKPVVAENIVDMVKTVQRNGSQEALHSPRFQFNRPTHFGSMINQGASSVNGFQQQGHLQTQSMSLPPGQYHNWEQPPPHVPQTSFQPYSQNFDQTRQQRQSHGNAPFPQVLQHGLAPPGLFQQSPNPFLMHEPPTNNTQQQSLTQHAVTFDTNGRIFQACLNAANRLQPQHQPEPQPQTISMSDLDVTISQSGGMSQIQSSPSRVASTAGESMCLLKSPDVEEPLWLPTDWPDDFEQRKWLNSIGSHPMLQKEEPAGASRPRPLMDQFQDLKPDGRIPAMQQDSIEEESGYYSLVDDADFVSNMFTEAPLG